MVSYNPDRATTLLELALFGYTYIDNAGEREII